MTDINHPINQQLRQDVLEAMYKADGRHDPGHPMHGLYTGLAQIEEAKWDDLEWTSYDPFS